MQYLCTFLIPAFLIFIVPSNSYPSARSWLPGNTRLSPASRVLDLKRSATMASNEEEEILMLSGYPFYVNGPDPKEIAKIADQVKLTLKEACGDRLVAVDRMGSSAIYGMAGTPVCDILAQVSPWPLDDETKATLVKLGYEFQGKAPHTEEDEWFFGGPGKPGHLGRVVLHTVPAGSEFVRDTQTFVAYVNSHPDAFQRYNTVKVEGARLMLENPEEEGKLIGYKKKKHETMIQIMQEAIAWGKQEQHENS